MGLTDPTPFQGVVRATLKPERKHLFGSEEKRIKSCEDSKDTVLQSIQEKNCQIFYHDLFSYFTIVSKVNMRSDL